MSVIELPDDMAAQLEAQASARGLTIPELIAELAGIAQPPFTAASPASTPEAEQRPIWEVLADAFNDLPADVLATLPTDGASQHDHYIYGWPKRDV